MKKIVWASMLVAALNVGAEEFSYPAIAARYPDNALSDQAVANATMQGECLVGLKELNFKKRDDFDPVAEWTSFRSSSLLEQFPPCQVLIIMETAQRHVRASETQ